MTESMLPASFQRHIESAKGHAFFGTKLELMSKEDLLGVIGFLKEDFDQRLERQRHESAFKSFCSPKKVKP